MRLSSRILPKSGLLTAVLTLFLLAFPIAHAWGQIDYQPLQTKASFRGLSVVSDKVIWASGTGGTFVRTTDGGKTWQVAVVPGAEKLDFRGIKAFDGDTCVLVSSGAAEEGQARIYRTVDGGAHWTTAYTTSKRGIFFDAVAFWDRRHGIAVSDPVAGRFVLLATDDGGATWHELAARMPAALPGDGAFAASNSSLAVLGTSDVWLGTGGAKVARVFHSADCGQTWDVVSTPVQAGTASTGIFSVVFHDARNGIVVGGDYKDVKNAVRNIAVTRDGGRTWTLAKDLPEPGLFLSSVVYVGSSKVLVATGPAGWARSTDGGIHWSEREGDGFNAVAFDASGRSGWAVGAKGKIARIDPAKLATSMKEK